MDPAKKRRTGLRFLLEADAQATGSVPARLGGEALGAVGEQIGGQQPQAK